MLYLLFIFRLPSIFKVSEVARISGKHCCCVEETRQDFKLRKLSEGKYLINGRTVFVRVSAHFTFLLVLNYDSWVMLNESCMLL